jgi:ABC-type cobalamin/Fe3+-siderophores transport system ATPase subunit
MKIFEVDSLDSGYGKTRVLQNISVSVAPQDFLGIIGPNGAGKSTFLKVLSGLLEPLKGSINFSGQKLSSYDPGEIARRMAFVPQFLENINPFKVENFVGMGRFPFQNFWEKNSREDREIIDDSLKLTGTVHLKGRLLSELSGGELQLVCIARALAQNKDVIICDEPVSSLDIQHSIQIMDLLYRLNREGSTIITVLHDINLASDYCSSIMGLKGGELFCHGKPAECLTGDLISSLFGSDCSMKKNPVTGNPYIYPIPEYI